MDLDTAIAAHGEWKVKFRAAIQRRQQLDAKTIGRDDQCPLGLWLCGEAKAKYAGLRSYAQCLRDHSAFHAQAGKVASAINAGKYTEAEAMLAATSPYTAASNAVGVAILGLRREAKL